jgi:hypothetical protein
MRKPKTLAEEISTLSNLERALQSALKPKPKPADSDKKEGE